MKAGLSDENPYQVKNKRFRRTQNEGQMQLDLSIDKSRNLLSVKSSQDIKNRPYQPLFNSSKYETKQHKYQKENDQIRHACSLEKKQLKRRKDHLNQEDVKNEQQAKLIVIIKDRERQIYELECRLLQKQEENKILSEKLFKNQNLQKQTDWLQTKLKEQMGRLQAKHSQQCFSLQQLVKRLEIEVSCLNRKWSVDYDRMLKEKELECKSLRDKYTSLLRSKRLKSKPSSIITQNPTSSTISLAGSFFQCQPHFQNDLIQLSFFELSKDDAL